MFRKATCFLLLALASCEKIPDSSENLPNFISRFVKNVLNWPSVTLVTNRDDAPQTKTQENGMPDRAHRISILASEDDWQDGAAVYNGGFQAFVNGTMTVGNYMIWAIESDQVSILKDLSNNMEGSIDNWVLVTMSDSLTVDIMILKLRKAFEGTTLDISADGNVYFAVVDTNNSIAHVFELFSFCQTCNLISSHLCDVKNLSAPIDDDLACKSDMLQRRGNLRGLQLSATGVDVNPFDIEVSLTEADNSTLKLTGGMWVEIFMTLASQLNFSVQPVILRGYKYGKFDQKTKRWDGMIGAVTNGDVNMSITPISLALDRKQYIDYTLSVMSVGVRIYLKRALEDTKIKWKFFFNPFAPPVYGAVLGLIAVLSLTLWAFSILEPSRVTEISLVDSIWLTFAALCQKGSEKTPRGPSAKLIFLLTYFTCLIIYCGYCATLISQLSVPPPLKLPFQDLRGLATSKGWQGGPIRGDFTYIFMQKTCPEILARRGSGDSRNVPCELLTQTWTRVVAPIESTLPSNFIEGLRRVLSRGQFAFITTMTGARYAIMTQMTNSEGCSIYELESEPLSSNIALACNKRLGVKKLLDRKLLQMFQSGLVKVLKTRWLPGRKVCSAGSGNGYSEVTIHDTGAGVVLVAMGLLLSCFMFAIEKGWTIARDHMSSGGESKGMILPKSYYGNVGFH